MIDYQPTLDRVLARAGDTLSGREPVILRPDGSRHRYTYADPTERVCQPTHAPDDLGGPVAAGRVMERRQVGRRMGGATGAPAWRFPPEPLSTK